MVRSLVRFDVRSERRGWTVIDTLTGQPPLVDGVAPREMNEEEAGEIADLLNTLQFLRRGAVEH